ncbi:helix-turn-helix domain-containing protein [Oceanobacillus sp. Castelsardo]|uniref:helix-turn-helix domain-containing protein n=1 Tax=Oceanobacillus sp. Castelsardo TaxID=1851204 RepID=UPI000838A68E|nr:helix-turn-helix domain-containing protein [Oceanobacillus sp. Castelsardo]
MSVNILVYSNGNFAKRMDKLNKDCNLKLEIYSVTNLKKLEKIIYQCDFAFIDINQLTHHDYSSISSILQSEKWNKNYVILNERFSKAEFRKYFKLGAYDCITNQVGEDELYSIILEICNYVERKKNYHRDTNSSVYYRSSVRESLAYDLIFGNIQNAREIWDRSQLAGLSVVPNTAMVVSVDDFHILTKDKGESWKQYLREEIIKSFEQYASVNEILHIIVGPEKIVILLALSVQQEFSTYKVLALQRAEQIKKFINEQTNYSVTIGIGHYYEDARNLHLSYQEGLYALSYRLFSGKNTMIHIDEVEETSQEIVFLYSEEIKVMANRLSIGDVNGVKDSWRTIMKDVSILSSISPKSFRFQILDILFSLTKSAIDGGAKSQEMIALQLEFAKELLVAGTLEEINLLIDHIVDCYSKKIHEGHNEQMLKSVQKALKYMYAHYMEDVSLETVAQHVNLSVNYFSTIFKETTGLSFIDYITYLRIEKAKILLMKLDYTIYKIADEIGYKSSRYFSRVFKSITGVTPTQYRNSILVPNVSNIK